MQGVRRSGWGLCLLGAVALLPLSACGSAPQTARAGDDGMGTAVRTAPTTETATPSPTAAPVGEEWPLVGGGTLDIASLSDQPLALWFWAPG